LILRNRLKYSLTRRESMMICMRRAVSVDQKVRTDVNFPVGFQDVVSIARTNEVWRVLYDVKGRFTLHPINADEAKFKLAKVVRQEITSKATSGRNPFHTGQAGAIPVIRTHDGRTIRYADPLIKVLDTVKIDLATGKVTSFVKFDVGCTVMVTGGANVGRVGTVVSRERHPGSFDIVHIRDKKNNTFATRIGNVFVIGEGSKKELISLPKGKGLKMTIHEEKADFLKKEAKEKK